MTAFRLAFKRRFLVYAVLPNLLFALVAYLTPAEPLIVILNLVLISLSVTVCFAFAEEVFRFIFMDVPLDKGYLLIVGIFLTWSASVLRSGLSIVWRWLGEPPWITNTDFTNYFLFLMIVGAVLHVLSPGSISEQIPPKRWIRIGAAAGIGVFLALMLLYASNIRTQWQHALSLRYGVQPASDRQH